MRDMEQEAEPEGGPIADKYGDMLNKIDAAIAKAKGTKPKSYDDTFNEGWNDRDDLFTFGYDLDMIQAVVDHLKSNYSEDDYELHIGRGDTHPNAVTLKNPNMESDEELGDLLIAAEDQEETDYQADRETYKDYMEEDTDVGHQDDEPGMLKSSAFETAQYAAKLYKKLDKYDQFDGEVDFPHWWQSKLILARDYMSAAFHYLNSEEKQPAIDQLALESNIKEEYTKEKLLAYLGQADDAMIRTHDDKYLIIYNPKNGNDDNASMWNDDSVFAVDQDGEEHEVRYDQIDGLQLEGMKEQALGFNHIKKLGDKAASHIDIETRRDSRYTFGNRPYQDDQLRYQIAKKLGYNVDSLLEQLKEGTDLYDRNGIQITRFSGGKRGVMVQINYGGKYIHIPAEEFPFLARAMQSVQDDLKDLSRQIPRSKNINERLSGDAREAIYDLQNILDQAAQLGDEARQIVKQHFPNELSAGDAYDVFNFGSSSNRYDKTLETLISDIERAAEEDEEAGYASSSDPDSLANEGQASIKKQLDKINLALKQHKDKTIAIVRKDAKQRTEDEKAHIAKMADLTKKKKDLLDKYGDAVAGINRNQELDA
jgi:hypothetical protein